MKKFLLTGLLLSVSLLASAKLQAPALDDVAKAKVAETAAKTAWSGKVAGYKLCKSQDKSAANYYKVAKAAGKPTKPATQTPPCADPGPFVYKPTPPTVAANPAAAPAKKS
jgi:Tfp pilus assembly protein PilV